MLFALTGPTQIKEPTFGKVIFFWFSTVLRCAQHFYSRVTDTAQNAISRNDVYYRLVVHESGLKYIFAGLGLELEQKGLRLGLWKICNQVQFQFSLCIVAVFCLGRMTFLANPYRTHKQWSLLLT